MEDVIVITENMFDAMVFGNPVCVGGVWISLPPNSEIKLFDILEKKLAKEYGLDVEEEA
jgi:hypothetical protein